MGCLNVILLCYRITCLWFCSKRFCDKKGHYLCQTLYIFKWSEVETYILRNKSALHMPHWKFMLDDNFLNFNKLSVAAFFYQQLKMFIRDWISLLILKYTKLFTTLKRLCQLSKANIAFGPIYLTVTYLMVRRLGKKRVLLSLNQEVFVSEKCSELLN